MNALLRLGSGTVGELRDAIQGATYAAVRAALATLLDKGKVRRKRAGRRFVYMPKGSAERARRAAARDIVQSVFDGSTENAIAALIDPAAQHALEGRTGSHREDDRSSAEGKAMIGALTVVLKVLLLSSVVAVLVPRVRLSAPVRHAVCLAALVGLALLPVLQFTLPLFPVRYHAVPTLDGGDPRVGRSCRARHLACRHDVAVWRSCCAPSDDFVASPARPSLPTRRYEPRLVWLPRTSGCGACLTCASPTT